MKGIDPQRTALMETMKVEADTVRLQLESNGQNRAVVVVATINEWGLLCTESLSEDLSGEEFLALVFAMSEKHHQHLRRLVEHTGVKIADMRKFKPE